MPTNVIIGVAIILLLDNFSMIKGNIRNAHPIAPRPPPLFCGPDILMFYQDCRMCVCPRPHKQAKCYRKSCDLRTKNTGQCPVAILKLDDSQLCPATPTASCKVDADCPANQLCCFDFCQGAKCMNPAPLDALTGLQMHKGRGYA